MKKTTSNGAASRTAETPITAKAYFPPALFRALGKRAKRHRLTVADYLLALAARDLREAKQAVR